MARAILEGRKKCTSRTKQYGQVGDTFTVMNPKGFAVDNEKLVVKLKLTEIYQRTMGQIRNIFYKEEGFNSPEEYEDYLINVVKLKWDTNRMLYLHWFEEVEE